MVNFIRSCVYLRRTFIGLLVLGFHRKIKGLHFSYICVSLCEKAKTTIRSFGLWPFAQALHWSREILRSLANACQLLNLFLFICYFIRRPQKTVFCQVLEAIVILELKYSCLNYCNFMFHDYIPGYSCSDLSFIGVLEQLLKSCHVPVKSVKALAKAIVSLSEKHGLDVSQVCYYAIMLLCYR
jgi:hypothetical protein